MEKNRDRFNWHDMPCASDPGAKAITDQVA
jgi:hypothetical protein